MSKRRALRRHRQAAPPGRRAREGHRADALRRRHRAAADAARAGCCARRIRTRGSCAIDTARAEAAPGRPPRAHRRATSRSPSASCRCRRTNTRWRRERVRYVGDPVAAVDRPRRADGRRGARPDRRRPTRSCRRSPRRRKRWRSPRRASTTTATRATSTATRPSSSATSTRRSPPPTTCSRTCSSSRATRTCRSSSTRRWPRSTATASSRCGRRTQMPHYVHRQLARVLQMPAVAHPRHRLPERRRLRRQERPLQPRDRGAEGGADARPAGEDLPHREEVFYCTAAAIRC